MRALEPGKRPGVDDVPRRERHRIRQFSGRQPPARRDIVDLAPPRSRDPAGAGNPATEAEIRTLNLQLICERLQQYLGPQERHRLCPGRAREVSARFEAQVVNDIANAWSGPGGLPRRRALAPGMDDAAQDDRTALKGNLHD